MKPLSLKLGKILLTTLILAACAAGTLSAQSSENASEAGGGGGGGASPLIEPTIPPAPPAAETKVDWNAIARQSLLFTGFQHAFRVGTEPGTRQGLKGPIFRGYLDSVTNLHGWGDGDQFYVNYVGHPMQGAVSGFIYIQNDSLAKKLRFGSDPRYWRTRMKAMGVSWMYSTWFEIGPISEASIGKIQSRRPQQGFVDHVVTPVIGTGWLVAEDFLDEKLILPFERRFENRWARMMVRSWLNPSRSFSNILQFKSPWHRDNRGGILQSNYRAPSSLAPEAKRPYPLSAPLEITAVPFWNRYKGAQCAGGGAQVAYRLAPAWQIVGQVGGCELRHVGANKSGDLLTYLVGPRWTPMAERRLSPYAQLLFGGNKFTRYEVDRDRDTTLTANAKQKAIDVPAEMHTQSDIRTGLALSAGTGVDIRLNPVFAFRLASVEYARSWTVVPGLGNDGRAYNHGLQLSTGLILRMGTW